MERTEIQEIAERIKKGDVSAIDECAKKYADKIFNYIRVFTKNDALAEDLTQEVFLKLLEEKDNLQKIQNFTAWLFRIAHNITLNELRRKNYKFQLSLDELTDEKDDSQHHNVYTQFASSDNSPLDDLQQIQIKNLLHSQIKELDENSQQIVALKYFSGLNAREISETLNIPIGTVCTKLFRSLKYIKEKLSKAGYTLKDFI